MKKTYLEPEVEIIESVLEGFLCGSTGAEGSDDDGGIVTPEPDPSDPDWGSDY